MKPPFSRNLVFLTFSSLNHLLDQLKEVKDDKKNLKKRIEALQRVLSTLLVLIFESEDEGICLLADLCISQGLLPLTDTSSGAAIPITKTVKAIPTKTARGTGLTVSEITAQHIAAMYRNYQPEIIRA
ncbi:MAG: hypothetical protein QNJ97_28885 [Myxococcota bacterium]|nr:hypothetical protein [Myxococcota bacterium]